VNRLRPAVVLGTGGFVALPVVAAAATARVPVVVHEQTTVPGLANRLAAHLARRIAVSWEATIDRFPRDRAVLTGNPLRPELARGSRDAALARHGLDPSLPLIYVTGGAQGAHRINRTVGEALEALLEVAQIIHQCGDNPETGDRRWLEEQRARLPERLARRYAVVPYLGPELADVYRAVSFLISRAGAGTLNECCHLGLPAIYIPLPGTSGDEQTANARTVERAGGCEILPQATLTPGTLRERTLGLLAAPTRLKEMGERARAVAVPDAAERIVALLLRDPSPPPRAARETR
jgi:UDP-N-acetylglucosamine--N-acetylmuramyl-(pentapeptide) pyrophosphoryl-undecaprenol N-acetylglucosamine transferase